MIELTVWMIRGDKYHKYTVRNASVSDAIAAAKLLNPDWIEIELRLTKEVQK